MQEKQRLEDPPPINPVDFVVFKYLGSELNIPSRYLQLFLDFLNDPGFDRSLLNYHQPDDIYMRKALLKSAIATNRSNTAATLCNFPTTVIDAIINCVEASHQVGNMHLDRRPSHVISTLECMSLVHPSWTWPAQKALGRELIVLTDSSSKLRKAVVSPLFGSWTDRAIVVFEQQAERSRWVMSQGQSSPEADEESVFLLGLLFKRVENITSLTLALEFHRFYRQTSRLCWESVFSSLASLANLRALTFLHTWSGVPAAFGYRLSHLLGELPRLQCLSLDTYLRYDTGRKLGLAPPSRDFEEKDREDVSLSTRPSPATLTNVHIGVGFNVPPDFVSWLLNACDHDEDSATPKPQVRDLSLAMNVHQVHRVIEAFRRVSLPHFLTNLQTLTLNLELIEIPEDLLTMFLHNVHANALPLRRLSITSPRRDILANVLKHLPNSLHELTYSAQLANPIQSTSTNVGSMGRRNGTNNNTNLQVPQESTMLDFESTLSTFLSSPNFRALYPSLRLIDLHLSKSVHYTSRPWLLRNKQQTQSGAAAPELRHVMVAAKQVGGLDVVVNWRGEVLDDLSMEGIPMGERGSSTDSEARGIRDSSSSSSTQSGYDDSDYAYDVGIDDDDSGNDNN